MTGVTEMLRVELKNYKARTQYAERRLSRTRIRASGLALSYAFCRRSPEAYITASLTGTAGATAAIAS
jgi:hypothetical protein